VLASLRSACGGGGFALAREAFAVLASLRSACALAREAFAVLALLRSARRDALRQP